MIKKKTVFVIGAGAGLEYDMPLGMDLKELIIETFRSKTETDVKPTQELVLEHFQYQSPQRYLDALGRVVS